MSTFTVKCKGLPYSTTEPELRKWFGGDIESVDMPMRDGKSTGFASVTFTNDADYQKALAKDKEHMGHRYIEVYEPGNERDKGSDAPRSGPVGGPRRSLGSIGTGDCIVRLRGLPFQCTERDIYEFFSGLNIVPEGVLLPNSRHNGRNNGDGYVAFGDPESCNTGLEKHMKNIQHRYIEVFEATYDDMVRFCSENRLRVPQCYAGSGRRGGYGGGDYGYQPYGTPGPYGGPRGDYGRPDPYSGYPAPAGYGGPRSEPQPLMADTFGPRGGDPYARPAEYGRGAAYEPWPVRGISEQGNGYAGWDGYGYGSGYQQGAGGGPMKHDSGWRDGPRGRERPGQKYALKMRGIPFRATDQEIVEFFSPVRPVRVDLLKEASGRPAGEARVEFESRKDYDEALLKDKKYLGPRYIELFPDFGRY